MKPTVIFDDLVWKAHMGFHGMVASVHQAASF